MSVRLIAHSIWDNPGNRGKRLRKTLSAVAWQFKKRTTGSIRGLLLPNGMRFNAYPDCVVSSSLIYSDWPEYRELMFIRRALRQGDAVIDVGANVGHISLLLSDVVGGQKVFAFEPVPGTYRRLKENWQLNGLPPENIFAVAVGESRGMVFIENDQHPTTTLSVSNVPSGDGAVEVPLVRLDDYRHCWQGSAVGFLKVDVEGYETEVFLGGDLLLREDRPRLIMFESLSGRLDARLAAIMASHAYTVFQLDEDGGPDFLHYSAQNLFAMPQEVLAEGMGR
jgi:FkbM family methyltransferase